MDIQHSIPAIGHRPGSIGWLADYLSDTELVVSETKTSSIPALFADFPEEDGLTFLCRPLTSWSDKTNAHQDGWVVQVHGDQKFKVVPVTAEENRAMEANALFGALTPAAEESAIAWRDAAVQAFASQWNNDGEEQGPVTVNVSR